MRQIASIRVTHRQSKRQISPRNHQIPLKADVAEEPRLDLIRNDGRFSKSGKSPNLNVAINIA
ncbi:hypothetical protein OSTOST_18326 [Ostertagia ostertagi]